MGGRGWTLLWLVFAWTEAAQARLICQRSAGSAAIGNGTTPGPPTTSPPLSTQTGGGSSALRSPATHCCGGRPFNADASLCCLGRVLSQAHKKCCLDGTNVPVTSRCVCYPTSEWIMRHMDRLSMLETDLNGLIEELHDREFTANQDVLSKQELINALDGRANQLFQSFLRLLGIDRNRAPREVDDIIETILFLNTNEQNMGEARKTARHLEESAQRILDATTDFVPIPEEEDAEEEAQENVPERLRRIRREIEILRRAVARAEEVSNQANENLEESLPASNNRRLREIILERDRILRNLTEEIRLLRNLRDRLLIVQRLKRIAEADRDLVVNLRGMLDVMLDEVIHMEAAAEEELGEDVRVERRKRDARTRRSSSTDNNCNFAPWERYVDSLDRRRSLVLRDLDDLLAAVDGGFAPPATLPRSTRAERSFFAPSAFLGPKRGAGVQFRERRDVALNAHATVRRLGAESTLKEAERIRERAFAWLGTFTESPGSEFSIKEKILPFLRKAKPH